MRAAPPRQQLLEIFYLPGGDADRERFEHRVDGTSCPFAIQAGAVHHALALARVATGGFAAAYRSPAKSVR